MHALRGHMLQKAAQEFVRRKGHRLALMVTTITIVEGDPVVIACNDRLVTERIAMHVATEILQDQIGVLHRGPCRNDPRLVPRDMRKRNAGQGPTCECEKPTSEALCQRARAPSRACDTWVVAAMCNHQEPAHHRAPTGARADGLRCQDGRASRELSRVAETIPLVRVSAASAVRTLSTCPN